MIFFYNRHTVDYKKIIHDLLIILEMIFSS